MKQPNILIVMTDHQRGDTVLPRHPVVAPNVKAMGREGVVFSEAFCPSPHCCPSRATFMSGLMPTRSGVWNNICNGQALSKGLNPGVRLWSEDLAAAGYNLNWTGKWHVSTTESPRDRGWTELSVSCTGRDYHGLTWDRYARVAAEPEGRERGEGEILRPGYGTYRMYGTCERNHHDEQCVEHAVEVLPKLAADGRPWGLYVGLGGPHDPYCVPGRYLDLYDPDRIPLPASFEDDLADKPRVYQRMRRQLWDQLSRREMREGVRHFWAYCTYLDDLFGRILSALDATGQRDDTLVVFTSDHGDYCAEHGLFCKGIPCFRGAYHVPLVCRWPNGIRNPGRHVDDFISLADFAPTLLDVAGLPLDRDFSGASFLPFLRGERPDGWRDEIHTQCNGVELYYTQRSVATKKYKYVYNGFDFDELYDLQADPHEMRNLADDPSHAAVKREMVGRMWRFARRENDQAINPYITVGLAPWGPGEAFRR